MEISLDAIGPLTVVLFLSILNSEVVDYLKRPLEQKFPDKDFWWFIYVSFATGVLVGFLANINVLESVTESDILGRILTGALVGGGSGLIYRIFKVK